MNINVLNPQTYGLSKSRLQRMNVLHSERKNVKDFEKLQVLFDKVKCLFINHSNGFIPTSIRNMAIHQCISNFVRNKIYNF